MKTLIVIRSQFSAIHSWPDCPFEEVSFLRNPHRHMFHVELKCRVTHDDRQLEFLMVKKDLDFVVATYYKNLDVGSKSCEMLVKEIAAKMESKLNKYSGPKVVVFCSVFEDNENGAEIYYE